MALKFPDGVASFVSCDTSSKSPDGNQKAWSERIAVAESESTKAQSGEAIVGEKLAEMTVRRWFVKESNGGAMEKKIERAIWMVINNGIDGFKRSVQALWEYYYRPLMKDSTVKGAFFVGSGDGVLPGAMKGMAEAHGPRGAQYVVIEGGGTFADGGET